MAEQRRRLVRLAVLEELRAAYGIKGKIFGISFNALPQSLVPEYGYIPSFLVDTCGYLEEHIHTEGLFRKSGSLVRLKALKSKLDQGENCLSAALPCDVAGLLKQFFRELPEPILPPHLQEGLLKAQQLGNEKKTATMLLSCLMADRTIAALRYFFNFLRTVSLRSNENRMDSSNLAVIFAPNLLHSNENEKMSTSTEKKIRLQAAVVETLIDHAAEIAVLARAESGKTGCFSPKISRKEMVRRSLRLKFGLGKSNREMNIVSGCAAGSRSENIGRRLASQQGLESKTECARRDVLFSPYVNEKFPKKGSRNVSKSEENLLTPKCHNKEVHRMSWNSPAVTDSQVVSKNEQILPGHSSESVSSSESVLIFGKPSVIPGEFKSATVSKQDNNLELVLCEDESNSTTETLLKVKEAFSASGSILHNLIGDKKSSLSVVPSEILNETPCPSGLSSVKELLVEEVSESLANVQSRQLLHQFNPSSAADKQQSKKAEIDILGKRNFRTSIEIELQVPKPDIKKVKELPMPQGLAKKDKFTVENNSTKDDLHKSDFSARREEIELIHSETVENCMVKCHDSEGGTAKPSLAGQLPTPQLPKSQNKMSGQYLKDENSDKVLTKTSTVSDHGKVSDHIQWFNQLSLNDPNSASKMKPPLKFQRTPVRQSIRRINSLLEANRQSVSSQTVKSSGVGSPLVKSLSYDSALFPCTEKPSKNSMLLPCRSESTHDQASVARKQLDLASKSWYRPLNPSDKPDGSVRTVGICEQKATVHPSKSVLEDLTNHEIVKSSLKVNANISVPGAAPEKSMIARSASGKERVRYRGSPKNPISEVKLLPTAKPVDL
ncbi:Rho GTPase-activating protein 11A [Lonchura striata]|uniref:Rho GTPase-activating protein 11A n=1 Tax=Lonchura striata TaxID=40157 RepID=A0A218V8F0_9PASE|nr:Rho GTPase-activating protein 11A [Lonchura striata domestica]